jgi:hypothetical protein
MNKVFKTTLSPKTSQMQREKKLQECSCSRYWVQIQARRGQNQLLEVEADEEVFREAFQELLSSKFLIIIMNLLK